jgi:hypothetical protein
VFARTVLTFWIANLPEIDPESPGDRKLNSKKEFHPPFSLILGLKNAAGALLVLPRTTLLEHEHNQEKLQQGVIANIGAAIKLLTYHGVALPEINARELVPPMISFLH